MCFNSNIPHPSPKIVTFSTHLSVLQVDLVAQHHKGEILGVSRAGLDQELVPPAVQSLEGVWCRDVENQDAAVGAAVERHA